jgi:Fe-Mn family superoxide dismutase
MAFELPALPYAENALEPHYSARTIGFHHGKHHAAYVKNLNDLTAGTELAGKGLEEIIRAVAGDTARIGIFNNAAQVWNHTFFWSCMRPSGGGAPGGALAAAIDRDFGSLAACTDALKKAATTRFGSGWGWLMLAQGKLQVTSTPNAETPLTQGATPLLTVDVWEHAYYLDYQNRRPDYLQTFLDKLVNWDFAAANLAKAG